MRKIMLGAIAGAVALTVSAVALAVPTSQTLTFKETFAVKKPGKSTATTFSTSSSNPGDPGHNNQPYASKEVDIKFPAGSSIDTTAVPVCTATDNQIIQSAGKACASKTKIATGSATADLEQPGSATINVNVVGFNGKKQLILYVQPSIGQQFVLRPKLKGNVKNGPTLVTTVPPQCLPANTTKPVSQCKTPAGQPAQQAVLTSFSLKTIAKTSGKGSKAKNYLTTPKKCPAGGWKFSAVFKYEDGTSRSISSKSPCTKK